MRNAISPDELVYRWELMRVAMMNKLRTADSEERRVIEVMDFMLEKCINELRGVLDDDGYPVEDLLTTILKHGK